MDVSAREKEVEDRLARERDEATTMGRHPMSRESSRQASARDAHPLSRETSRQATTRGSQTQSNQGRKGSSPSNVSSTVNTAPNVRPAFSFASAAKRGADSTDQTGKTEQERGASFPSPEAVKEDNEDIADATMQKLAGNITQIAV